MRGLDQLREAFIAAGWHIYPNSSAAYRNECDWIATNPKAEHQGPDCACNDRPPQIVAYPYESDFGNGAVCKSVEFDLTGETPCGNWVKFRVYSIKADESLKTYPQAARQLYAAWAAAVKEGA